MPETQHLQQGIWGEWQAIQLQHPLQLVTYNVPDSIIARYEFDVSCPL
jgi:hypothetical protein